MNMEGIRYVPAAPGRPLYELIIDGVNGVRVQTVDASGLAQGIHVALAAADFAEVRGSAREFAARFDREGLSDQYERLFESQLPFRAA